ncbi:MAG: apolipoprotein N-acyltransferase [Verrucomicrobia bacterium]|nr:apolipoprotein N-acyltransferase [Verrucomicrobiota bacterium]
MGFLGPLAASLGFALFFFSIPFALSPLRKAFAAASWFGTIVLIQLSWMTSIEFQGIYILFVYGGLAIGIGLFFGAFTAYVLKEEEIPLHRVLYFAALWTLFEWARLFFLCGYSWNPIGMTLATSLLGVQLASVLGVFGLSFWVMGTNLLGFNFLRGKRGHGKLWILATISPYLIGGILLLLPEKRGPSLQVALVQTGLTPSQKVLFWERKEDFISPIEQWRRIVASLKEHNRSQWDLIVLPEAAVPYLADLCFYPYEAVEELLVDAFGSGVHAHFPPLAAPYASKRGGWCVSNLFWCRALSNIYQAEMLVGLDCVDRLSQKNHNAAFFLRPGSWNLERYDKQILLPLAEYLPFAFLHKLTKKYGIFEFFSHGTQSKVMGQKVCISPSICYEETFPRVIREGRRKGAELLVNLTNDNYYPQSSLPEQHFAHARLRAVENGAPLVRACNTGVTAAVDSRGRVCARLSGGESQAATLACELKIHAHPTLYTLWGDAAILAICLFICLISTFYMFCKILTCNGLFDPAIGLNTPLQIKILQNLRRKMYKVESDKLE